MSPAVLHLGDISGTSRAVIEVARSQGLDWTLRDVPAGRGRSPIAILASRLKDLFTVRTLKPKPDVLHINYGVSGYYGWGRRGVVLHLHGTDVRQDLNSRWLGPVVLHSLRTADAVLYSTLDLRDAVTAIRPDAQWFPAPVTMASLEEPREQPVTGNVFFASRWDDTKGAVDLLRAAKIIAERHPELTLTGLDWGTHREAAAAAGIALLPHLEPAAFRKQLERSQVVVGQLAFGVLGISDVEALCAARPLIANSALSPVPEGPPLYQAATALEVADQLDVILNAPDDAEARAREGRAWAVARHSPVALEQTLESVYEGLTRRS
ncbi:glycosyltransferase family protein [Arthrobacter woluwensis]|uniref:hypothetical protein n=1 Tax=Arthrobacter woluwensis TaxID=156980 RepID=UPI00380D39FE